jgi:hypothetical protein
VNPYAPIAILRNGHISRLVLSDRLSTPKTANIA